MPTTCCQPSRRSPRCTRMTSCTRWSRTATRCPRSRRSWGERVNDSRCGAPGMSRAEIAPVREARLLVAHARGCTDLSGAAAWTVRPAACAVLRDGCRLHRPAAALDTRAGHPPCDLAVITAMTGDEWPATGRLVTRTSCPPATPRHSLVQASGCWSGRLRAGALLAQQLVGTGSGCWTCSPNSRPGAAADG